MNKNYKEKCRENDMKYLIFFWFKFYFFVELYIVVYRE